MKDCDRLPNAVPVPLKASTTNAGLSREELFSRGSEIFPKYRNSMTPIFVPKPTRFSGLSEMTMPVMPTQYFPSRYPITTAQDYFDYYRLLQSLPPIMPSLRGGMTSWIYNRCHRISAIGYPVYDVKNAQTRDLVFALRAYKGRNWKIRPVSYLKNTSGPRQRPARCRSKDFGFGHGPGPCTSLPRDTKRKEKASLDSTLYSPNCRPKRMRTAFSPIQLLELEKAFEKNRYLIGEERKKLARSIKLSETQIKVWFQNKRAKMKRKKQGDEIACDAKERIFSSEEETASPKLPEKDI